MLVQCCFVLRQQSIEVRQEKAGGLPSFIQVVWLACLRDLGHITAEDVKGVALHHDPGEPTTWHANHSGVAAIGG